MNTATHWILGQMLEAVPRPAPKSIVKWAEREVKLVGSARSESYRASITPWTIDPIECGNNGTRRMTFVKPVQSGGSAVGEIVIEFWLSHWVSGDLQYNWPTDVQADE